MRTTCTSALRLCIAILVLSLFGCGRQHSSPLERRLIGKWRGQTDARESLEFFDDGSVVRYLPSAGPVHVLTVRGRYALRGSEVTFEALETIATTDNGSVTAPPHTMTETLRIAMLADKLTLTDQKGASREYLRADR